MTSSSASRLDNLPLEILQEIFTFVGADLYKNITLNRHLSGIIKQLINKDIHISADKHAQFEAMLLSQPPAERKAYSSQMHSLTWTEGQVFMRQGIRTSSFRTSDLARIGALLTPLPHLVSLSCPAHFCSADFPKKVTTIRHLRVIIEAPFLYARDWRDLIVRSSNTITELDIELTDGGTPKMKNLTSIPSFPYLKRLRFISLRETSNIKQWQFLDILQNAPALENLELGFVDGNVDAWEILQAVGPKLRKLTILDSYFDSLEGKDVQGVCPNVKYIHFKSVPVHHTWDVRHYFPAVRRLRIDTLVPNSFIEFTFHTVFGDSLPLLEVLEVNELLISEGKRQELANFEAELAEREICYSISRIERFQ